MWLKKENSVSTALQALVHTVQLQQISYSVYRKWWLASTLQIEPKIGQLKVVDCRQCILEVAGRRSKGYAEDNLMASKNCQSTGSPNLCKVWTFFGLKFILLTSFPCSMLKCYKSIKGTLRSLSYFKCFQTLFSRLEINNKSVFDKI